MAKIKREILKELTNKRYNKIRKKLIVLKKSTKPQQLENVVAKYVGSEVSKILIRDKRIKELSSSKREKFIKLKNLAVEIAKLYIEMQKKFSTGGTDAAKSYAETVYEPRLKVIESQLVELIRSIRGQAGCGDRAHEFIETIIYIVSIGKSLRIL